MRRRFVARRQSLLAIFVLPLAACVLYSGVSITPLFLLPSDIWRPTTNVVELVEAGDYPRVLELARSPQMRGSRSSRELAAIGAAELASGRFPEAKEHLLAALQLKPFRDDAASIAWNLSQVEYLDNNHAESLRWAREAIQYGMGIRQWHLDFLDALSREKVYEFVGASQTAVPMGVHDPDIPRVDVELNGSHLTAAFIDSGAVVSIISRRLASQMALRPLGTFQGTFFGLLGEPITVSFGIIDSMRLGEIEIRGIPVAIMPDEKLDFVVVKRERFKMDLLLGANFLKEFRVELDYDTPELILSAIEQRAPAANQNLFFVGFRPFVHATINRKGWYPFILDTGSEITFLNEGELGGTRIRTATKIHGALLQGLGGAKKHGAKVEDVEIGVDRWAGKFRNLPLYSSEKSNALGIVGEDFLRNFRVVIDFGTMRVDLYRAGQFR
ncbi:MAG TPA: retroviral-like aspartic protease family protein [Thermoanaerobaculia bacterium]